MQLYVALVLVGSLANGIHAFAPIWCMNRVLMPEGFVGRLKGSAIPQPLVTSNVPDSISPSTVPYFGVRPDHAIVWHDKGLCLEASDENVAQLNLCTSGSAQKWNWIPDGHGGYKIQLKNSNMCLDVLDGEDVVVLRGCHNRGLEAWRFQEPISPAPAQSLSELRHVMVSLLALAGIGLLGLSILHWNAKHRIAARSLPHGGALINISGSAMTEDPMGGNASGCARPPCTRRTRQGHISMVASESGCMFAAIAKQSFWSWRLFGAITVAQIGGAIGAGSVTIACFIWPKMVALPVLGISLVGILWLGFSMRLVGAGWLEYGQTAKERLEARSRRRGDVATHV